MANELVIQESRSLTAKEVRAQKNLIHEVMKAVMLDGTHYGIIPGCKQPSLYKAGSEAILTTFRIAVEPAVEDLSTHDCYRYRVTCRGILPSGEIVGAGVGEASTDEEKYHWRGAVSDAEFQATPEDRRRIKYQKTYTTNQVRTNPADLANTVLKMAKKRAQIDLTLTATGASDVFVQDLEDMDETLRNELVGGNTGGKPPVTSPQSKSGNQQQNQNQQSQQGQQGQQSTGNNTASSQKPGCISEAQAKMIFAKLKNAAPPIPIEDFMAYHNISRLGELPADMMKTALENIESGVITGGDSTTDEQQWT